ncbi:MAG TPA: hypothetical protein P5205_00305 [Candidatus Paceibacterota bacterium]|nr:hypothetical protein [Verrucomicrobiota bacterium]HSA08793.1 hypothetical protein [Candidatus Paceibacterota bacterium]
MKRLAAAVLTLLALFQPGGRLAQAWDYEAHRAINQLALAALPTNFPAFVHEPAAAERIAFLAGEMDRWRNTPDLPLKHYSFPDHYIDVEELADYGLKPEMLPVFRYDFIAQLALHRAAHPEKFPEPDASSNQDRTRGLVGLLPWGIAESAGKLKSGFSYLKAFEEAGTPEEIANAQANIVYVMGVMGHLIGDGAQPLHTTIHHHGWVGDNPHHYTTSHRFHSWIDGGYFRKTGGVNVQDLKSRLRTAQPVAINGRPANPEEIFQVGMLFLLEQHKQVEPLYQMDRDGKLSGEGDKGLEGKAFLEGQLLKAGQLLGDFWFTAWQQAPPDTFLKGQLARRQRAPAAAGK